MRASLPCGLAPRVFAAWLLGLGIGLEAGTLIAADSATANPGIVVACANAQDNGYTLYTVRSDGSGRQQVGSFLARPDDELHGVVFARNGRRAACAIYRKASKRFEILVSDLDGKESRKVVDGNRPSLSPDGRFLACLVPITVTGSSFHREKLHILDLTVGALRPREGADPPPNGDQFTFDWAPDGSRLLFVTDIETPSIVDGAFYAVNPQGAGLTKLSGTPDGRYVTGIALSPDGRSVAIDATTRSGNEVYVMGSDGTGLRKVLDQHHLHGRPWSADGRRLYVAPGNASSAMFSVNLDGSDLRQVIDANFGYFFWVPRGARALAVQQPREGGGGRLVVFKADATEPYWLRELERVANAEWIGLDAPATSTTNPPPPRTTSFDLTGYWRADGPSGPIHYVRQIGDKVYWSHEDMPRVRNVFVGTITENVLTGTWTDLPGGQIENGFGTLNIQIDNNDHLTKLSASSSYPARTWVRVQRPRDASVAGSGPVHVGPGTSGGSGTGPGVGGSGGGPGGGGPGGGVGPGGGGVGGPGGAVEPWNSPVGQACFERWIAEATQKLNALDGGKRYNDLKPWGIHPRYGTIVNKTVSSVSAPDDFPQYGNNKYWWLWAHYTTGADGLWIRPEWNAAGVPDLHAYVLKCMADLAPAGTGGAGGGGPVAGGGGGGPAGGGPGGATGPGGGAGTGPGGSGAGGSGAGGSGQGAPGGHTGGIDLTGYWRAENGSGPLHYVRQIGNRVEWSMEDLPRVRNVFTGTISGSELTGTWVDLPGGDIETGTGTLKIMIESNDRLNKISSSPHYAASLWVRVSKP